MSAEFEILLIAVTVAMACVLPGVFLVLRGMSLMSDAISHAVLLGIVLSFFWVKNLQSPILLIAASATGVLTVTLTELLVHSRRLKQDAAIGLVFPVLFSIGVILINLFASQVHIDTDAVLLGELAFAPFNRWMPGGIDLGPIALWTMGAILLINAVFVGLLYKELKLATFDPILASALGFRPVLLHYGLMTITSITAVSAFDAVGSILVVAFIITPAATAYLITTSLLPMILWGLAVGALSAVSGYGLALILDVSIAGAMATMCGLIFLAALVFSPRTGLLQKMLKWRSQRLRFSSELLCVQLLAHEDRPDADTESRMANLTTHMGWTPTFARRVTQFAAQTELIFRQKDRLYLTPLGRETARVVMVKN